SIHFSIPPARFLPLQIWPYRKTAELQNYPRIPYLNDSPYVSVIVKTEKDSTCHYLLPCLRRLTSDTIGSINDIKSTTGSNNAATVALTSLLFGSPPERKNSVARSAEIEPVAPMGTKIRFLEAAR